MYYILLGALIIASWAYFLTKRYGNWDIDALSEWMRDTNYRDWLKASQVMQLVIAIIIFGFYMMFAARHR